MASKSIYQRFFKLSILMLTLLSFYCHAGHTTATSTTLNLPAFSSISAAGNVKIIILEQQPKQNVTVFLPPKKMNQIKVSVQNYTLIINAPPKNRSAPILIKINMSQPLKNISLTKSACLSGGRLNNPNMHITLGGSASIHLQGTPHSIQNDGMGDAVITGVNGNMLIVNGNGHGRIIVSGRVQELAVKIGGSVVLDAQRLHAEIGHIETQRNATAYVCVFGPLHAFAYDNSDIYYYYTPSRLVRDTHASGNVLKITPDRRLVPLD